MGWEPPKYAHLPVIMKLDEGKRRKLSKRHDKEAAVSFFLESGYPKKALLEYLFTLANSNLIKGSKELLPTSVAKRAEMLGNKWSTSSGANSEEPMTISYVLRILLHNLLISRWVIS